MDKTKTKPQEMFDQLVENAIDFLSHSLEELEEKPKYSVINFCVAIELFLKARLLLEHWSLVIEDPQNANITKFLSGEFKTVGIDDAIQRLEGIANFRLPKSVHRAPLGSGLD